MFVLKIYIIYTDATTVARQRFQNVPNNISLSVQHLFADLFPRRIDIAELYVF